MRKHTTVYAADEVRLKAFTGDVTFAVFRYGDAADMEAVSLHLTPVQVATLAAQCREAVAEFRACGALPAEVPLDVPPAAEVA